MSIKKFPRRKYGNLSRMLHQTFVLKIKKWKRGYWLYNKPGDVREDNCEKAIEEICGQWHSLLVNCGTFVVLRNSRGIHCHPTTLEFKPQRRFACDPTQERKYKRVVGTTKLHIVSRSQTLTKVRPYVSWIGKWRKYQSHSPPSHNYLVKFTIHEGYSSHSHSPICFFALWCPKHDR